MSEFEPHSGRPNVPDALPEPRAPLLVRDGALGQQQPFTASALGPAIAGALAAALVGGMAWGLVIVKTDYEVGILAWALGFVSGYAVLTFAGGRRGPVLQAIAALGGVLGILVGKYVAYVHFLRELVRQEFGDAAAGSVSYFDTQVVRFFFQDLSSILGGFDLLWVAFAVLTAWRIPRLLPAGGAKTSF